MFRALAVVGVCSAMLQPATASTDKLRVLATHRWYTEAYVRDYMARNHPTLTDAFHKSIAYAYAADAPVSLAAPYTYRANPMSSRRNAFFLWSAEDAGKNLNAEIDDQCVLLISKSLSSLKFQVSQVLVKERVSAVTKNAVITAIKTGELAGAPLDLSPYKTRPISLIPPEGNGRLLCNVYTSTMRRKGLTYEFSVVLTAPGFYARPR